MVGNLRLHPVASGQGWIFTAQTLAEEHGLACPNCLCGRRGAPDAAGKPRDFHCRMEGPGTHHQSPHWTNQSEPLRNGDTDLRVYPWPHWLDSFTHPGAT